MKLISYRTGAVGLAVAVAAGLGLVGAGSAVAGPNLYAPSIGTITSLAPTGTITQAFSIKTSGLCPAGTSFVNVAIDRPSAGWNNVSAVGSNTNAASITSGIPLGNTIAGIAADAGVTLTDGTYDIALVCNPDFFGSPATGQFDAQFTVTGSNFAFAAAAVPSSTTTLTVNPTSGTPTTNFTFTATVASSAATAGTVQFKEGSTVLGSSPVTAGSATFSTTFAGGGSHPVIATFVPTNPAVVTGSSSAASTVTVTAPAQATTTTLSFGPATPTTADVVSLTATLTPATATGTVTFKEGATTVGTATVSGGTAAVSLTGLSASTHTYTADFAPSNPANYLASSAAAVSVPVTQYTGASAAENITTTIGAGTLTITAGGPTVDLGTPVLNSANTLLVTAPKDINNVTVTDTRAGSLGWNVNGTVADFVSGVNKINSENLGWTPRVVSASAGQTVTAAPAVAPGNGLAASAAATGAGLKAAKPLASAAVGASVGTAVLNASLVLQAPTSTPAGTYNTVLTLTAI